MLEAGAVGSEDNRFDPQLRLGPDQVGQVRGLVVALPSGKGGGQVQDPQGRQVLLAEQEDSWRFPNTCTLTGLTAGSLRVRVATQGAWVRV